MQRAYDQLIHDVAIQNLPVLFTIDRAGIVVLMVKLTRCFDLSFMRCIPNMIIMTQVMKMNVAKCFTRVINVVKPAAVRYPCGNAIGVELTHLQN